MVHRILSALDAITGISMLIPGMPINILIAFSMYLTLKGLFFAIGGDKISIIDFLAGVYIILMTLSISSIIITVLFAVFLIQKMLWCFKQ